MVGNMQKLYVIYYSANECDDICFDDVRPIYYSLDETKARNYFENLREKEIESLNEYLKKYPEYKNLENYQFSENTQDRFEYSFGKWMYEYYFEEVDLEVDLRYPYHK